MGDNIKMDLMGIVLERLNWIYLYQGRDWRKAQGWKFVDELSALFWFSVRTVLHGVCLFVSFEVFFHVILQHECEMKILIKAGFLSV
jgi:hypothetical protein